MRRHCEGCGTPLPGRHMHGFVRGRRLVCGRRERLKGIRYDTGERSLKLVATPECAA